MEINYVTGNAYKIFMTKQFMQPFGITINQIKMDTPEIQEPDVCMVAKHSAEYAYKVLQKPVLKNDGGLYIPALNGFPAAFTKFAEDMLGEDGILKLMAGKTDRTAYWLEALAYCDENGTKVFVCKTMGKIALQKSGEFGWGYDRIFIPDGQTKTLANFEDSPRGMLWDNSGYTQLAKYVLQQAKDNSNLVKN